MAKLFGTNHIRESAGELGRFVKQVQRASGAQQVDLVGWSQGGVIIRTYLKYAGGASPSEPARNLVKRVVTLGSPHHGTALSGIVDLAKWTGMFEYAPRWLGPASPELVSGSPFLRELNEGGETFAGIHYTSIYSSFDTIVNPPATAKLSQERGATVQNIDLQEGCALDFSSHEALPFARRSVALVLQALDPERTEALPCELQLASVFQW